MSEDNSNANDEEPTSLKYEEETLLRLVCVYNFVVNNDTTALRQWLIKRNKEEEPNPLLFENNQGWTALHVAASQADRKECLELLLKYRDNVSLDIDLQTTSLKKTALYIACDANCEGNALLLLLKGCNPNIKAYDGQSPLHIAVCDGYGNIVTHLLNYGYGININDKNFSGLTALHLAAVKGNIEIGRILLENGADVELKESSAAGDLSMHLAVKNGNTDFLRLIIDKKPSIINVENKKQLTALHLAVKFANVECISYLLDHGAKWKWQEMIKSVPQLNTSNTRKAEIIKPFIERLEVDDVKNCVPRFMDFTNNLGWHVSITCAIIDLRSVECLSLLLESGLPKYLLQAPSYELYHNLDRLIYTPLLYVLNKSNSSVEIVEAMMRLLLNHDIIFIDEYLVSVGYTKPRLWPASFCFPNIDVRRFRRFYQLLADKGVTVDYPVRCLYNAVELSINYVNSEMELFYIDLNLEISQLQTIKLYIHNSCILEPSILVRKLIKTVYRRPWTDCIRERFMECFFSSYSYLIELTPIFYLRHTKAYSKDVLDAWELVSPVADEFAKSTLKQFCRTEIRKSLRGKSIDDDLFNFQRKIDKLPLPTSLKNYLLFKN